MRKILTFLLLLCLGASVPPPLVSSKKAASAGAAYTLLVHATANATGDSTATTSGIDTTGAKLIVIVAGCFNESCGGCNSDPSDSNGNTWTALASQGDSSGNYSNQLYYALNPTVGAAHTFSLHRNYPVICVAAFSGGTPAFDAQNGFGHSGGAFTTIQPGSVSPATGNELFITGLTWDTAGTASINSSFTISDQAQAGSAAMLAGLGYKTSSSAENPTWTVPSSGAGSTTIAAFK